jgi:hypothetical protein
VWDFIATPAFVSQPGALTGAKHAPLFFSSLSFNCPFFWMNLDAHEHRHLARQARDERRDRKIDHTNGRSVLLCRRVGRASEGYGQRGAGEKYLAAVRSSLLP